MHRLALERDGEAPAFRVHFTRPIAAPRFGEAEGQRLTVQQYHYDYWWEYGSPERGTTDLEARAAQLSPTELLVTVPALEAGRVARLILAGVVGADGTPLLLDYGEGRRESLQFATRGTRDDRRVATLNLQRMALTTWAAPAPTRACWTCP